MDLPGRRAGCGWGERGERKRVWVEKEKKKEEGENPASFYCLPGEGSCPPGGRRSQRVAAAAVLARLAAAWLEMVAAWFKMAAGHAPRGAGTLTGCEINGRPSTLPQYVSTDNVWAIHIFPGLVDRPNTCSPPSLHSIRCLLA